MKPFFFRKRNPSGKEKLQVSLWNDFVMEGRKGIGPLGAIIIIAIVGFTLVIIFALYFLNQSLTMQLTRGEGDLIKAKTNLDADEIYLQSSLWLSGQQALIDNGLRGGLYEKFSQWPNYDGMAYWKKNEIPDSRLLKSELKNKTSDLLKKYYSGLKTQKEKDAVVSFEKNDKKVIMQYDINLTSPISITGANGEIVTRPSSGKTEIQTRYFYLLRLGKKFTENVEGLINYKLWEKINGYEDNINFNDDCEKIDPCDDCDCSDCGDEDGHCPSCCNCDDECCKDEKVESGECPSRNKIKKDYNLEAKKEDVANNLTKIINNLQTELNTRFSGESIVWDLSVYPLTEEFEYKIIDKDVCEEADPLYPDVCECETDDEGEESCKCKTPHDPTTCYDCKCYYDIIYAYNGYTFVIKVTITDKIDENRMLAGNSFQYLKLRFLIESEIPEDNLCYGEFGKDRDGKAVSGWHVCGKEKSAEEPENPFEENKITLDEVFGEVEPEECSGDRCEACLSAGGCLDAGCEWCSLPDGNFACFKECTSECEEMGQTCRNAGQDGICVWKEGEENLICDIMEVCKHDSLYIWDCEGCTDGDKCIFDTGTSWENAGFCEDGVCVSCPIENRDCLGIRDYILRSGYDSEICRGTKTQRDCLFDFAQVNDWSLCDWSYDKTLTGSKGAGGLWKFKDTYCKLDIRVTQDGDKIMSIDWGPHADCEGITGIPECSQGKCVCGSSAGACGETCEEDGFCNKNCRDDCPKDPDCTCKPGSYECIPDSKNSVKKCKEDGSDWDIIKVSGCDETGKCWACSNPGIERCDATTNMFRTECRDDGFAYLTECCDNGCVISGENSFCLAE